LTTLLSTPEYLAPELTGCRAYIATDTFQLGLLLHDLLYKKHAFIDTSDVSLRLKEGDEYRESEIIMYGLAVKYGNYHASKDEYGNLLSRMLEKDPSKRPDLTYVKNKLMNIYNSKFYSEHKEPVSVPISSTNSLAMISTCVPVNISANPHEVKV
jgi:serine/threonine protein kinase